MMPQHVSTCLLSMQKELLTELQGRCACETQDTGEATIDFETATCLASHCEKQNTTILGSILQG